MQDRYAGDVGDFGKLGMLRSMLRGVSLGVAWWMVPDETHERVKNDGRHVGYLDKPQRFGHLDGELFRRLGMIVRGGRRSVRALQDPALLPGAIHHDRRLDFAGTNANSARGREGRATIRQSWVREALAATAACDAVFLDPDNGFASNAVAPHHAKAPKYVFASDLGAFLERPQVVIAYHHADRSGAHGDQAEQLLRLGGAAVGPQGYVSVLRFVPYSPRFFVIMATEGQAVDARHRVEAFMATGWSSVFERV